MAQRVSIILEDDIDGGEASETISFAVDGTNYEIDLNEQNANALRDALQPYIKHGRRQVRPATRRQRRGAAANSNDGPSAADIRAWAQANGHQVPERGRIPAAVREAYEAAN